MNRSVVVLGGAGFIGSRIAMAFEANGDSTVVLDGFLPRTGARKENLAALTGKVIESRIEAFADLSDMLGGADLIIDAMGWTCHRLALRDPAYDLELNMQSHIHWLRNLPPKWPGRVVYLGSRGQYGNPSGLAEIVESTPQVPEDIQGVHKTAAESHFRIVSKLTGIEVASLRFPACVGPHQPTSGEDIGLFGGFVRDLWSERTVDVYGENRRREILHVDDLAETVVRLAMATWSGFQPFNVAGHSVVLVETLKYFQNAIGRGTISVKLAPPEVAAIDIGATPVNECRLAAIIGKPPKRSAQDTLQAAVEAFRP